MDNKCADQAVRMRRLVCTFVVYMQQNQGFLTMRPKWNISHMHSCSLKLHAMLSCEVRSEFSFTSIHHFCFCFVWGFTSQSTAMVMLRWSVHLTTLFPGQAWLSGQPVLHAHTFACNWQAFLNQRKENDHRNYFIINLHESMGPGRDRTLDPWICSWTH